MFEFKMNKTHNDNIQVWGEVIGEGAFADFFFGHSVEPIMFFPFLNGPGHAPVQFMPEFRPVNMAITKIANVPTYKIRFNSLIGFDFLLPASFFRTWNELFGQWLHACYQSTVRALFRLQHRHRVIVNEAVRVLHFFTLNLPSHIGLYHIS